MRTQWSSSRLRRLWRRTKNALTYWPARGALAFLGWIPLWISLRLAGVTGALIYTCMPSVRRLSRRHLAIAFGEELPLRQRDRIARRAMMNTARCFCEVAKFDDILAHLDDYVEVDGEDIAAEVLQRGKGAIVVTGHLGNWELLAAYFARKGLPVAAVARRIYDERINSLIVGFRERQGIRTILREDPSAARKILQTMRQCGVLAMVVDQDTHAPSMSVPFFGRPARSPIAPATLALRRDIPIVAAFIERRPQGGHRITIQPPIVVARSGKRTDDVRRLLVAINAAIEGQIRHRPEEWVWWHRRWRRAPIPHLDLDGEFKYAEAGSQP